MDGNGKIGYGSKFLYLLLSTWFQDRNAKFRLLGRSIHVFLCFSKLAYRKCKLVGSCVGRTLLLSTKETRIWSFAIGR
jgi:hypothetical protein